MNPTSFPELFKTLQVPQKPSKIQDVRGQNFQKNLKNIFFLTIFGPEFGILAIPSGQYIELDMRNPIFRSEMSNSSV